MVGLKSSWHSEEVYSAVSCVIARSTSASWLYTVKTSGRILKLDLHCFSKTSSFYFCNSFVGGEPILIFSGKNIAQEICNLQTVTTLLYLSQNEADCKAFRSSVFDAYESTGSDWNFQSLPVPVPALESWRPQIQMWGPVFTDRGVRGFSTGSE